jgi:hypothetical protein
VRTDSGGASDDNKLTGFGCFSPRDKVPDWIADRLAEGPTGMGVWGVLCVAKDETSVNIMCRRFCCNFLWKSRL